MNKKCFVVSPIGNVDSKTRNHSDNVNIHLIKKACSINNMESTRVDEITTCTYITQDIFQCLDTFELVIADISELNANVFFEIGYRIKTGKPIVIIKDSNIEQNIPFDIHNIRILDYSLMPASIDKSIDLLDEFIKSIDFNLQIENIICPATDTSEGLKSVNEGDAGITFRFTKNE